MSCIRRPHGEVAPAAPETLSALKEQPCSGILAESSDKKALQDRYRPDRRDKRNTSIETAPQANVVNLNDLHGIVSAAALT